MIVILLNNLLITSKKHNFANQYSNNILLSNRFYSMKTLNNLEQPHSSEDLKSSVEELGESFVNFTDCCNDLLDKFEKLPEGTDIVDWLVSLGNSDDEKMVIKEMCEEVDVFQKKKNEFNKSSLKASEWFEQEIENTATELFPDATKEEVDVFKKEIETSMDSNIRTESECLSHEVEPVLLAVDKLENSNPS